MLGGKTTNLSASHMFEIFFVPLLEILLACLRLYRTCIFVYILINLLQAFNLLSRTSLLLCNIQSFLAQLIEPTLSPIRRLLPRFGVIDLSPIILIFALQFCTGVVQMTLLKYFHG